MTPTRGDVGLARFPHAAGGRGKKRPVVVVQGGISAWRAAARPFAASPDELPDAERIDYVFWNHDRHDGNHEAMRAYLRWETELPAEIARDGQAGFRPHPG